MQRYSLEFILNTHECSLDLLRNSIIEFGDSLEIIEEPSEGANKGNNFKINICTEDPTIIFDACAGLGRIKSVKINEEGR